MIMWDRLRYTVWAYWILVVIDQYTRRIVGFGIQAGIVDGMSLCRMLKDAMRGAALPKYISSDHDPLYRFYQWEDNLRVLEARKSKPCLTFRCRIRSSND
jgi:putative transposase